MRFQSIGRCVALLLLALAFSRPAGAQTQVYVLDGGTFSCRPSSVNCRDYGPYVQLINTLTGHTLATIPVGAGSIGTSVRLSSDGALLFVTTVSQLTIIDTFTRLVVARVAVPFLAVDVAILPDNSRAYVVSSGDNSVSVVDLTSFTVVAAIPVQSVPAQIVVSPDGNSLYVTNSGSRVSKISAASNSVATHIAVGTDPTGLDISPDGTRLFVANSGSNSVSVIDATSDSVLRVLPAGSSEMPPRKVAAQSATRVYVHVGRSDFSTGNLQLLNAADGAVVGATVGGGGNLARDSSGTPVFVVGGGRLKIAASDGTSTTTIATGGDWTDAAVVTDPCAFEATASPPVFGLSGGTGVLTIPAPAGCPWTIDPSGLGGVSIAAPLSGTGPQTRDFTIPASSVPELGIANIRRQAIAFEQTIPRMNVELASGGAVLRQPFAITGWAIEEHAFEPPNRSAESGVDQIHVWAYPTGGGPPLLINVALLRGNYGRPRSDIAALYGDKYRQSGFRIVVSDLPSGSYTLAFFAHSSRSNTFSNVQTVDVTVDDGVPAIFIDAPAAGAVTAPFLVAGWAADPAGAGGSTGVDVVHVWAYPSSGAPPIFLGQAAYGGTRPDVAAFLGPSFQQSGYGLMASLPPGDYTLVVFARSASTGQFKSQTVRITVQQ